MDRRNRHARRRVGAEEELQRDALGVIAHDLGSVTAALALRADVLAQVIPVTDTAALQSLADDLRDQGRLARLIRGPVGSDALSPMRQLPLDHWWRVVAHTTAAVLPRGVVVNATLEPAVLAPTQAHLYTILWLAACKALAQEGVSAPCTIELASAGRRGGDVPGITASCSRSAFPVRTRRRGRGRWQRYAEHAAEEGGITLGWWIADGDWRIWSCAGGAGTTTAARSD